MAMEGKEAVEEGELVAEDSIDEEGDRISVEKLKLLGPSDALKGMLHNPYLRQLLQEINQSHNPQKSLQRAMDIPVFVEFADECLKVCDLKDDTNH